MSDSDIKLKKQQQLEVGVKLPLIIVGSLTAVTLIIYILFVKSYVFNVSPEKAIPLKFHVNSGVGFFMANKLYTVSASNTITVHAPKYLPATVEIFLDSESNIDVELKPMPSKLEVDTNPKLEKLSWYVNGSIASVTPTYSAEIPPQALTLKAVSPYHEPVEKSYTIEVAESITDTLQLTSIKGQLVILSEPIGATVTINDKNEGQTPTILDKEGGKYKVAINLEGYEPLIDTIDLNIDDKNPNRNYLLQPLQARLVVNAKPSGGSLLVDGKPAKSSISVDADKLHTVSYNKKGYELARQSVTIPPGVTKSINISLEPELAQVSFSANMESMVSIDGKIMGRTPLSINRQTLPQKATFSRQGYRTVTKQFQAIKGRITEVSANLMTEFDARRAEGKPLVAEQMGIELLRIEGKPFMLGSAVNVPYRERHEHQIKVEFERPFWLATKEISQAQYAKFKQGTAPTDLPVTDISWQEAAAFCNWLSEQEGLPPFYNLLAGTINKESRGYRLPTEAEWEFAASKYMQYTTFKYFWGNQDRLPTRQGNFGDKSLQGKQTFVFTKYQDDFPGKAPVGKFKVRNRLYDMDGNVSNGFMIFITLHHRTPH